MLFNLKSKKKYFSLLLVLVILFSSVRLDSLLVFAYSTVNNDESFVYNQESDVEDVDETVSYDELGNDLAEQGYELELDADDFDEQALADYLSDNDDDFDNSDDINIDTLSANDDVVEVATFAQLQTAIAAAPTNGDWITIRLTDDISAGATDALQINGGRHIILDAADRIISSSLMMFGNQVFININQESTLILEEGTIVHADPLSPMIGGRVVYVNNSSTFIMNNDATITFGENTAAAFDVSMGVNVTTHSTFIMNGSATVGGVHASNPAVLISTGGMFIMNDSAAIAVLSSNLMAGFYEGGVTIADGTFKMNGGSIQTAFRTGVSVGDSTNVGTFEMNGGNISGSNNSGVVVDNGTFTMTNGTITGNTAIQGAGVRIDNRVSNRFTMSGGSITDNAATLGGGGVSVLGGTFEMTGGTIAGNVAMDGGGIYWHPNAIQNMIITPNATVNGNLTTVNGTIGGTPTPQHLNNDLKSAHGYHIQPGPWGEWDGSSAHVFNNHDILSHEEQVHIRFLYNFVGAPNNGIFRELSYITNGQPMPADYAVSILANPPVRAGYTFIGWYVDAERNDPFNFATPIIGAGEVNIYAGWESLYREVTFNLQGGVAHEAFANQRILYGELATRPAITPERVGHEFVGWYVGDAAFNFETTPIVADTTISARWSLIQGQGGTGTPPSGGNQSGPGTSPPGSGSGNQPDSGSALRLPQTGLTQRNVLLLIGFGLLFGAVVTSHLKKKTSSNDLEQ